MTLRIDYMQHLPYSSHNIIVLHFYAYSTLNSDCKRVEITTLIAVSTPDLSRTTQYRTYRKLFCLSSRKQSCSLPVFLPCLLFCSACFVRKTSCSTSLSFRTATDSNSTSKMSLAAALSQALKKLVISFIPTIPHDKYRMIPLEFVRNIRTAAHPNNVKKKVQAFYCDNTDVEYILRTIQEFEDIADNRMQIAGGQQQFKYFRECLGGTTRKAWDAMSQGQPLTVAGFDRRAAGPLITFLRM